MADSARIVLLVNPSREYTRGLLRGIPQYVHLRATWTLYRPLEYREKTGRRLVAVLKALKPDGVFMREPAEPDEIVAMGLPVVCFPYTRETIAGVANVITDHEAIGQMAARHLLDRGFRQSAYCGFDDWWWPCRRRGAFARLSTANGAVRERTASRGVVRKMVSSGRKMALPRASREPILRC